MSDEQTIDSLWDADAQHTGRVGVLKRGEVKVRPNGTIDWFA